MCIMFPFRFHNVKFLSSSIFFFFFLINYICDILIYEKNGVNIFSRIQSVLFSYVIYDIDNMMIIDMYCIIIYIIFRYFVIKFVFIYLKKGQSTITLRHFLNAVPRHNVEVFSTISSFSLSCISRNSLNYCHRACLYDFYSLFQNIILK